jgi:regulator of nucleoside diphosphate kinase
MEPRSQLPQIVLTDHDHEKLSTLIANVVAGDGSAAGYLADELARANVVAASEIAANVVTMHSEVEFRDETNGRVMRARLVYPVEADIAARRLSILTPVGAALIGLSEGDSIEWEDRNGNWRMLTVLKVS